MRKSRGPAAAPKAVIKLGATYRDARGTPVVAEDFEVGPRGRTGRVIVCAADSDLRFPRRWYCRAAELEDVPGQGELDMPPAGGGLP